MGDAARVWLATGSAPLRRRLLAEFPCQPDVALLGHCEADDTQLERRLAAARPQVLLVDWPGTRRGRGHALLRRCAAFVPFVLVVVEAPAEGLVEALLRHRLHGFLLADSPAREFARAIARVLDGEIWMPRAMLAAAVAGLVDERAARMTVEAARDAARNRYTLRERQVVGLVRQGMTNKQIGRELGIVEDTVKKHLQHIYDKVGVRRRSLLALARSFSSSREAGWSS